MIKIIILFCQLLEKMKEERGHVSDIIRQEFADRIVTTEEENRRIKNEISELRAKHRIELERARQDVEDVKQAKDAELEEVHARSVDNAIGSCSWLEHVKISRCIVAW